MENMQVVRWGILGCGNIARKFVQAVEAVEGAVVQAAASRNLGKAQQFAQDWNIPLAYGGYEKLWEKGNVDAVYIATPHNTHFIYTRQALLAGMPVLCEKPFTVTAAEAWELYHIAQEKQVFCMEAMWTRMLPAMRRMQEMVRRGDIGQVRRVAAQYCFSGKFDPSSRLYHPGLAGGALLDVGVYPLAAAAMIWGSRPQHVQAACLKGKTGVDEMTMMQLEYEKGSAYLSCGISMHFPALLRVEGTEGSLEVPQFYSGESITITHKDGSQETEYLPFRKNGFEYEIEEAGKAICRGDWQSSLMPLEESVRMMELLDEVRCQCGIVYPFEVDKNNKA